MEYGDVKELRKPNLGDKDMLMDYIKEHYDNEIYR